MHGATETLFVTRQFLSAATVNLKDQHSRCFLNGLPAEATLVAEILGWHAFVVRLTRVSSAAA